MCDGKVSESLKVYLAVNAISLGSIRWCVETSQLPNGDWIAFVPTLGRDLFRGIGETPQEAQTILANVAEHIFEWYVASGARIPDPTWDDLTEAFHSEPEAGALGLLGIFGVASHASTRIQSFAGANTHVQRRSTQRVLHNVPSELFASTC